MKRAGRRAVGRALSWGALLCGLLLAACVPPGQGAPGGGAAPPEGDLVESHPEAEPETEPEAEPEPRTRIDLRLAETRRQLGLALEAAGDLVGAVSEFEAALAGPWPAATPVEQTPWGDLARICGRAEPAEAVARACGLVVPSFRFAPAQLADFLANRGDANVRLGRTARALRDYATALELESSHAPALLGRARLRIAAGEPRAALNDLRLAAAVGARKVEARLERARVWRALGEPERAVAEYDAVLADAATAPFHPTAWRGRAEAHCALGLADAAALDWQVWADSVPGGASYLHELLRARGYLRGPRERGLGETGLGRATLDGLRAWTRAGCPGADAPG
ncbi:MAG TPA: tetratricopeptide repeat protein [Thermohalobaculum sp.]|nr:tetratricopeptide repeat protein [Thermohalobaculum sp.]